MIGIHFYSLPNIHFSGKSNIFLVNNSKFFPTIIPITAGSINRGNLFNLYRNKKKGENSIEELHSGVK